jgi:hypothetical protein
MNRELQAAADKVIITILFCLIGTSGWAQRINAITFDKLPQDYQLYPRNAQSEAQIPIAGRVEEDSWQYVSVQLFRDRQPIGYKRASVSYSDGKGRFAVDPFTIRAEKAEYDIKLYLVKGADSVNVVNRTNIVAGDVYVFAGQSNASAFFRETRTNEFCRTFGKVSGTYGAEPYNPADTAWAMVNQSMLAQNVGTFAFEFQQQILEKYGIPTCVINGAVHWSTMASFANRSANNPADLTNGYGRILYRLQKAGIDKAVKALIYRQGESEAYGDGGFWSTYFDTFYRNLKIDLPSIKHVYVFQIDIIDYAVAAAPLVREAQRALIGRYNDVQVIPSVGTQGFDGLHYTDEGYIQNAQELTRLVGRDVYNSSDVDNIDAPNIQRVEYANRERTEISLLFNDRQELVWTDQFENQQMKDYFYINGRQGEVVAGRADGNRVILTLRNPFMATRLSYLPAKVDPGSPGFPYRGPYITNKRGMRALSFYEAPIIYPFLDAPVLAGTPLSETTLQLSWNSIAEATGYILEVKGPDSGLFRVLGQLPAGTTAYRADGLSANTTYTFRIKSVGSNTESIWNQIDSKTPDFLKAPVVQGMATFATAVSLSWQSVPDAGGYVVERRLSDENGYTTLGTLNAGTLSYSDRAATPNSNYTYRVKATGRYSDSPYGSVSVQTPALLATPEITVNIVYNNALVVDWKAIPNATSYQVERKAASEEYKLIGTYAPTATSIKDTNLTPGTLYSYRIKAIGDRTESPVASMSAVTPAMLETPELVITPTSFDILTLSWKANRNATHYLLERKMPDSVGYEKPIRLDGTATEYIDTRLMPNSEYAYRIMAYGDKTHSALATAKGTTQVLLAVGQDPAVTLRLWPNPTTGGEVSVRFSGPVSGLIQVLDLRGKVYQQQEVVNAVQLSLSLTGGYPAGMYLIHIKRASDMLVQKLLIN